MLSNALKENQLTINDTMQQQLLHYLDLLTAWNRVFNLTTITTPREMVYLHIIDSLSINAYLHGTKCLDVGSGAGLPGIPLAIINPQQSWTLLDKNSKKTRFLTQAAAELKLHNVNVIHQRSQDFHINDKFDSIISRAFGTIHLFVETTHHLLNANGVFIAMKGKYPQEELSDIPHEFIVQQAARLDIKGINIERHVVCLRRR